MSIKQQKQQGLSLVEMMIALLLSALTLSGAVMLFQQSKSNSVQDEQVARMQENGRLALRVLSRELSMMGFWGGMLDLSDPGNIDLSGALPVGTDCLTSSGGWMLKFTGSPSTAIPSLQLTDEATNSPYPGCIDDAEILDGADVLAIKRVADQPAMKVSAAGAEDGTVDTNAVYFKTNTVVGAFYEASGAGDEGPTGAVPNPNRIYQYLPAVFYVRPYSRAVGDAIPALVRETLVGDSMAAQPLVEGVENLQLEFGIDGNDADLSADFYTGTPTAAELRNAVSARIYVLVRSVDPVAGYVNDKTYNLGSTPIDATNDAFYRRVYSTTIQMRNADKLKLYALN